METNKTPLLGENPIHLEDELYCRYKRKWLSLEQCLDGYLDANAPSKQERICYRCPEGNRLRKEFSQDVSPEAKDALAKRIEELAREQEKRRGILAEKRLASSKKPKPASNPKPSTKEDMTSMEEKERIFLQIMSGVVGDSPHKWISLIAIIPRIEIYPWWKGKKTILAFKKLGIVEINDNAKEAWNEWQTRQTSNIPLPITFRLTSLGIQKAGLKDVQPTPPPTSNPSGKVQPGDMWNRLQQIMEVKKGPKNTYPTSMPTGTGVADHISEDLYRRLIGEIEKITEENEEFTISKLAHGENGLFSSLTKESLHLFLDKATREDKLTKIDEITYRRTTIVAKAGNPKPLQRIGRRKIQDLLYANKNVEELIGVLEITGTGENCLFKFKSEAENFLSVEVENGLLSRTAERWLYKIKSLPTHVEKKRRRKIATPRILPAATSEPKTIDGKTVVDDLEVTKKAVLAAFHNKHMTLLVREIRKSSDVLSEYTLDALGNFLAELAQAKIPLLERVDRAYRLTWEGWRTKNPQLIGEKEPEYESSATDDTIVNNTVVVEEHMEGLTRKRMKQLELLRKKYPEGSILPTNTDLTELFGITSEQGVIIILGELRKKGVITFSGTLRKREIHYLTPTSTSTPAPTTPAPTTPAPTPAPTTPAPTPAPTTPAPTPAPKKEPWSDDLQRHFTATNKIIAILMEIPEELWGSTCQMAMILAGKHTKK